jgi:hypothetical protein
MNTELNGSLVVKNEAQLLRALQTKLRSEFQDWCGVVSLHELAENPRLMQIIPEIDRTLLPGQESECAIIEYETIFDRLLQSVSKRERRNNSRLTQKTVKIRLTLALLRRIVKPG